jgi:hypothetical protein
MSVTVKKKITVNGKEYHSLDELPPDIRALYDQAMASKDKKVTVSRIVISGHHIEHGDDVPADIRDAIDGALGGEKSSSSNVVVAVAIVGALVLIALKLLHLI